MRKVAVSVRMDKKTDMEETGFGRIRLRTFKLLDVLADQESL